METLKTHLLQPINGATHVAPIGIVLLNIAKYRHEQEYSDLSIAEAICQELSMIMEDNNFVLKSGRGIISYEKESL